MGTVGLDIHLADLVEDFTYFNVPGGRSYVFLIDSIGKPIIYQLSFETIVIHLCAYRNGVDASGTGQTKYSIGRTDRN